MPRPRKPRKHRNRGSARLAALAWLRQHSLTDAVVNLSAECGEIVAIKPEDLLRVEPSVIVELGQTAFVVFACRPSGSEDDVLVYFDRCMLPAKARTQVKAAIQHYHEHHVHTQNSSAASN